jgi:hypothetical protein
MRTPALVRWGAYLGVTLGITGWLLGFALLCLSAGATQLLAQVLGPGLALNGILACLFILVAEGVIQRFGYNPLLLNLSIWALLLAFMGLLMFVLSHWLAPLIDQTPALTRKLNAMGSVYRVADSVSASLMGAGLVLLSVLTGLTLASANKAR